MSKKNHKSKKSKKHPNLLMAESNPMELAANSNTIYITDCFGWFYKDGHKQCKKCPDSKECEIQKRMNKAGITKAREKIAKRRGVHPNEIEMKTNIQITDRSATKKSSLKILDELKYNNLKIKDRRVLMMTSADYLNNGREFKLHLGVRLPIWFGPVDSWRRCDFGYLKLRPYQPLQDIDSITTKMVAYILRPRVDFEEEIKSDKAEYNLRVRNAKFTAITPADKKERRKLKRDERKRRKKLQKQNENNSDD